MEIKNKKGFTLIELLVVIAIIALLASIVLVALSSARSKARDAKRRGDLVQMSQALALYFDNNNAYPDTSGSFLGVSPSFGSKGTTGAGGYIPNLSPTYIGVLPVDPKPATGIAPGGLTGGYIYQSNGTDYYLMDYGSVENWTAGGPMQPTLHGSEHDYAIWTPGLASAW